MSPFSCGEQGRPNVHLQLRLNHFSTFLMLLKRRGSSAGESGLIVFPVRIWRPDCVISDPWQSVQLRAFPDLGWMFFCCQSRLPR